MDHRLASEQGRAKIQEDFTKSGMIVDTVTLIATTDRVGITDFFKETGKSHTTYEAIKSEIANNPELAAQLKREDLTPTEKEAMLNQLTHSVMVDLGYSTGDYQNVLVANEQDHVVKDGVTYERHGFYSEETPNAYINDAFISDTEGLVTTAGHELSHAMDDRSGTQHSKQDNEIYATQFGNNFGNYTNVAMAVTGNGSMAGNNQHVGNNSEKVRSQTEGYNQLDKGQGDDLVFLAAPAAAPLISPAAVTAVVSLATAFGLKVNEDNIAEMLGVEGKPTSYITPEHTTSQGDTRVEGSAIAQGEATILATPAHHDNYGLLVNIPVGLDVNGNSGGYQQQPISQDDLVMMAEDTGPNVTRHSDGSYRTPDGKFASVRGVAAPGTNKAREFVDHLRKNGMDVVGEEVVVRGPLGDRRYDAVIRDRDGRLHGLEIKSGSAMRNGYQEFSDMHVNQFGADGKGIIRGERVESSSTVYVP